MFDQLKKAELDRLQQAWDLVKTLDPRHEVVVQKKKNYTWLIVLGVLAGLAVVGVAVYKLFFECCDDFEDFDDEDFEDIDYDEDYDEDYEEDYEVYEDEVEDDEVEDEEE